MNIIEGDASVKNFKFAVIVSRFNEFITDRLLEGAQKCFTENGYDESEITVIKVPGAFEIPLTAAHLASQKKYSAIICLGAVIRGATPHFDYVSMGVATGVQRVSVDFGIPVIFGVLTTNTIEQAMERSGGKSGNKGRDAVLTAIEMADLINNRLK